MLRRLEPAWYQYVHLVSVLGARLGHQLLNASECQFNGSQMAGISTSAWKQRPFNRCVTVLLSHPNIFAALHVEAMLPQTIQHRCIASGGLKTGQGTSAELSDVGIDAGFIEARQFVVRSLAQRKGFGTQSRDALGGMAVLGQGDSY